MNANITAFLRIVKHPLKFRLFLLSKLPSAYFAGARIKDLDESRCVVAIPYKWFSRNPFRSTYFACLAMAGEMSTGALALAYSYHRKPAISLLVKEVNAQYIKKATGLTSFVCEDGQMIGRMIEEAVDTGEVRLIKAKTIDSSRDGEIVAEMYITWSIKAASKK